MFYLLPSRKSDPAPSLNPLVNFKQATRNGKVLISLQTLAFASLCALAGVLAVRLFTKHPLPFERIATQNLGAKILVGASGGGSALVLSGILGLEGIGCLRIARRRTERPSYDYTPFIINANQSPGMNWTKLTSYFTKQRHDRVTSLSASQAPGVHWEGHLFFTVHGSDIRLSLWNETEADPSINTSDNTPVYSIPIHVAEVDQDFMISFPNTSFPVPPGKTAGEILHTIKALIQQSNSKT